MSTTSATADAGRSEIARSPLATARSLRPLTVAGAPATPSSEILEQEALQELDAGIEAAPSHAGLRKCRANVRRRLGDLGGAAQDAAEAIILDPDDLQAKAILGIVLLDLHRAADAAACLAEAVAGAPANLHFRRLLSTALEQAGDNDAALRTLTDGIALCLESISTRNAAILLCIRQGDFSQAQLLAEDSLSQGVADSTTLGLEGHACFSLGRHEKAATAYRHAWELGSKDPYIRHFLASSGALPGAEEAREAYVRSLFEGYAHCFESHLIALRYTIPGKIRTILQSHPKILEGLPLGPVLDLGCGTGFVALVASDLPLGPFTGVDLSPRMLDIARAKQLYSELQEGEVVKYLNGHPGLWPLIIAADVLCYLPELEPLFKSAFKSLTSGGWFIFSLEEMSPICAPVRSSNGNWALQRQGRYVHSADYVCRVASTIGFRIARMDRPTIRQESGKGVPGLLFVFERPPHA